MNARNTISGDELAALRKNGGSLSTTNAQE
jgi:hypothetical protein